MDLERALSLAGEHIGEKWTRHMQKQFREASGYIFFWTGKFSKKDAILLADFCFMTQRYTNNLRLIHDDTRK